MFSRLVVNFKVSGVTFWFRIGIPCESLGNRSRYILMDVDLGERKRNAGYITSYARYWCKNHTDFVAAAIDTMEDVKAWLKRMYFSSQARKESRSGRDGEAGK